MGTEHDRRRFLGLAAGASTLTLAGCSTAPGDSGTSSSPTEPDESTDTDTPTSQSMSTVFHFARGPDYQQHALANVANLLDDSSTAVENVVVVANGQGVELLVASESNHPDRVTELLNRGVSFRACENSLAARDIEESALIDGVETVPAGVGELTKLQARDDFAYIETP
ncbi:DsrE family protein [Haloplanus aerogenes]|uniref:Uncharacterized protein n=1 Tax=Haloplanus aerogenes TaxID=660522 RepID=A0A3M0DAT2_9EURY|nr:DsrE family protein [Haloplanus aerogenes]AZH26182.1 hypothetical protein DU502_12785 [Haloplanus aerogenes]RMB18365.1 hypothetical protein ATH50_1819 [Haloplanus aerogenes]